MVLVNNVIGVSAVKADAGPRRGGGCGWAAPGGAGVSQRRPKCRRVGRRGWVHGPGHGVKILGRLRPEVVTGVGSSGASGMRGEKLPGGGGRGNRHRFEMVVVTGR